MSEQTHFLERTSRLEDAALQRAMTIYRDPNAREWLGRMAAKAGLSKESRIAVPLGPQPSPAYVILDPKGDVVTCLSEGMVVVDSEALVWSQVEEVFAKLATLSGGDPDPHWTWRRLWRVLVDTDGWLPREAYEIFVRERLMVNRVLHILYIEAFKGIVGMLQEEGEFATLRYDRQPKEFRAEANRLLWHLRHVVNLAGDVGILKAEEALPNLLHFHFGHADSAAAVALGRTGPQSFEWMQKGFLAAKSPFDRADFVRGIAIAAARQPAMAVPAGRFLKRLASTDQRPKGMEEAIPVQTAMVALYYLGAQGGRVASEVVSVYNGKPDPKLVDWFADLWKVECAELHDRWPSGDWKPTDLYPPRETAEAEHRKGPRPCPDPLEVRVVTTLERTKTKVHRNDPCPCGSGKKAKKCCGTQAEYSEGRPEGLPRPCDAEWKAFFQSAKGMQDRVVARAKEAGIDLPPLDQWT